MSDDLIVPADPVNPAQVPSRDVSHGGVITCEACGSRVTRSKGEILDVGARVKAMRKAEERAESLQSEIESLTSQLATAREELAALKRPVTPAAVASSDRW